MNILIYFQVMIYLGISSKTYSLKQIHLPNGKCQALAGTLRDLSGEKRYIFVRGLCASFNIPNSNICETRPNFKFNATVRMSGKNLWAEIIGPKVGKVSYFQHFFQFFKYNCRDIHFRRNFLQSSSSRIFVIFRNVSAIIFRRVIARKRLKWSNLQITRDFS